jgi:hypothetical protein
MQWNFDASELSNRRPQINVAVSAGTLTWLKSFAAAHGIAHSNAARFLIEQAVRFWSQNRHSLARSNDWLITMETEDGNVTELGVSLPPKIADGLRQMSAAAKKSVSRMVTEILFDARKAFEDRPIVPVRARMSRPDLSRKSA